VSRILVVEDHRFQAQIGVFSAAQRRLQGPVVGDHVDVLAVAPVAFAQRLVLADIEIDLGRQIAVLGGVEAHDVSQAHARLSEHRVELVLLDVQIPGGGGEVVLRTIRNDPAFSKLPVVAVTAAAMSGDRARFLAAGFDGYISKPIDTKTFASVVEGFIEKGGTNG